MLPLMLGIGLTLLDQVTKELVRWHMDLYEAVPVVPGLFDLRYIQNSGAAWGLFAGYQDALALLSFVVLVALAVFRRSFFRETLPERIAFGCLLGGITGNFLDRVRLGYVVDFLDFHWSGRHFPAFNVADSAICIGVGIVMIMQVLQVLEERRQRIKGAIGGGEQL